MTERESRTFRVRARGEMACFTRPEMKVERVSYEVMPPSAARGLLEAVLWKPAIEWRIHAIEVLAPIRWLSVRRNEVNSRASLEKEKIVADEDRAQRNTVALREVDYVVHASIALTPRAGDGDTMRKFEEMFERRLERGQHHSAPFFGCREFAAALHRADETPPPIDRGVDRPLGCRKATTTLPVSALQHLVFCERQVALLHVLGRWAENVHTTIGRLVGLKQVLGRVPLQHVEIAPSERRGRGLKPV